jgi:hypothetical protein
VVSSSTLNKWGKEEGGEGREVITEKKKKSLLIIFFLREGSNVDGSVQNGKFGRLVSIITV